MLYSYFFLFEELKKLYKQDLTNLFKTVACGTASPLNGNWGQKTGTERREGGRTGAHCHPVTKEVQGCMHLSSDRTCQHKQPALCPSHVAAAVSRLCHLLTQVSSSKGHVGSMEGRGWKEGKEKG